MSQAPSGLQGANPVQLWDLATRTRTVVVNRWARSVIKFSPDSKLLAFVDGDEGVVLLWDVERRHEAAKLPARYAYMGPLGLAFSSAGDVLAYSAGGDSGDIVLWDISSRAEVGRLPGHASPVHGLAFSEDGRTLFSAGDTSVRVWDWRISIADCSHHQHPRTCH